MRYGDNGVKEGGRDYINIIMEFLDYSKDNCN